MQMRAIPYTKRDPVIPYIQDQLSILFRKVLRNLRNTHAVGLLILKAYDPAFHDD